MCFPVKHTSCKHSLYVVGAMKAYYLRGKAHMEVWNEAEAKDDFTRVLDLDPGMKKTVKKMLAVLKMRMEVKNEEDRLKYKGMFTKISRQEESLELEIPEQTSATQENPEEALLEETAEEQTNQMTLAQSGPEQTPNTSSDHVIPEHNLSTPEQTTREAATPEQLNAVQILQEQSTSEETSPEHATPEPTCPEQADQDPVSSDSEQTSTAQITPEYSTPVNEP